MLYYSESDCFKNFPSPEELKSRVILSTKPPKEYLESKISKEKGSLSPDGIDTSEEEAVTLAELLAYDRIDSDQDDDLNDVKAQQLELKRVNALNSPRLIDSGQDDEVNNGFSERKSQPPGAPEYKRLNALHAGKPKNGLRDALKVMTDKVKRLSLSELALERAASSHGTDVVRFTQKNVLSTYPKGTRVNSSNYRPMVGWMPGAQMVAFNMQGYGKSLWLMHGMFRSNGECGYVKKPDLLMKKGPKMKSLIPEKHCQSRPP
uniref:Phosphoinositide phospholipase C n=1 Tax=Kalanchoe fedtschenkoi TaxID=63787 RepID=A0A7N0ZS51_KALFE